MKNRLGLRGTVIVEKIRRDDGKVVERRVVKNALSQAGAQHVLMMAYNPVSMGCASDISTCVPKRLFIMNRDRSISGILNAVSIDWSVSEDAGMIEIKWSTTPQVTYYIYYLGMVASYVSVPSRPDLNNHMFHFAAFDPPIEATAGYTLNVVWRIRLLFTTF